MRISQEIHQGTTNSINFTSLRGNVGPKNVKQNVGALREAKSAPNAKQNVGALKKIKN
jgi:hypothetical protein